MPSPHHAVINKREFTRSRPGVAWDRSALRPLPPTSPSTNNRMELLPPEPTSSRTSTPNRSGGGSRGTTTSDFLPQQDKPFTSSPLPSPSTSTTPRDAMISELQQYLTHLHSQVDDGGCPVVVFPPNYGEVVSAMSRGDLTVEGQEQQERPWMHYLLDEGLATCDQGYKEEEVPMDAKILRGLAKIRQLDRVLTNKTREAKENTHRLQAEHEELRDSLESLVQSLHWDSIPRKALFLEHKMGGGLGITRTPCPSEASSSDSTPLPTDRSTMSEIVNGRRTFLTSMPSGSSLSTGHPTPRTSRSSSTKKSKDGSTSSSTSSSSRRHHQHQGSDWVQFNIDRVGAGTRVMTLHLSAEDEKRYQELVSGRSQQPPPPPSPSPSPASSTQQQPEEEEEEEEEKQGAELTVKEAWVHCGNGNQEEDEEDLNVELTAYGMTPEERERIQQIDQQLCRTNGNGGESSLSTPATSVKDGVSTTSTPRRRLGDPGHGYLDLVRDEREREQRMNAIDAALRVYQRVAPLPNYDEASLLAHTPRSISSSRYHPDLLSEPCTPRNDSYLSRPSNPPPSSSSSTPSRPPPPSPALGSLYSIAYRALSHSDIHAAIEGAKSQLAQSPLAQRSDIDNLLEQMRKTGIHSLPPTPLRTAGNSESARGAVLASQSSEDGQTDGVTMGDSTRAATENEIIAVDVGVGPDPDEQELFDSNDCNRQEQDEEEAFTDFLQEEQPEEEEVIAL